MKNNVPTTVLSKNERVRYNWRTVIMKIEVPLEIVYVTVALILSCLCHIFIFIQTQQSIQVIRDNYHLLLLFDKSSISMIAF